MTAEERKNKLKLINAALKKFPKVIADEKKNHKANEKIIAAFMPMARKLKKQVEQNQKVAASKRGPILKKTNPDAQPIHHWRRCPHGQHWVVEHPKTVTPSDEHPDGKTDVVGHCAWNPSHKDELYPNEIREITEHFKNLEDAPNPDSLGFKSGNLYDSLIAGWTQYWNDILQLENPLDPNVVKALIASESSFIPSKITPAGKGNWARGLMQVIDQSRQILEDQNGEIQDHFVYLTETEALDPTLNICAGIRWLFQKRKLAEAHYGEEVEWDKVIYFYKAAQKNPGVMKKYRSFYRKLTKE
jgi:hypothetical protein